MHYLWWITLSIIYFAVYAWISKQNNVYGGKWFWIILIYGFAPIWAFVSRYSKRLLFDGMLYDNILFLTYAITMIIIGTADKPVTPHQWFGIALIIFGSVLMRM